MSKSNLVNPLELFSERFNDARNFVQKAIKGRNHWKTLYGLAPISEAYARGDLEIHLHLPCFFNLRSPITKVKSKGIKCQRVNMPDYCIRIQRHPYLELTSTTNASLKGCANRPSAQNSNEAMLVGIVKVLKKKKGIAPTLIPSLVWLKRLQLFPEPLVNMGNVPIAVPSLLLTFNPETAPSTIRKHSASSLVDGELDSGVGVVNIDTLQLPSQKVKCRAEIMNKFSNSYSPLIRKNGGILNTDILVSSFSIELGQDNTVGIFFKEPMKSSLQGYELALCPLDLSSWPVEWLHNTPPVNGEA